MRVAIHQPNFMPWMGLFQRLYLVDRFVVFDHVQAMGGRSWLSRNRLLVAGREMWLTVPVRKTGRLGQRVIEVQINYQPDFVRKHLRTIEVNYRKAPYFEPVFAKVSALFERRHELIAEFNMEFIRWVCDCLELPVEFVHSRDLLRERPELDRLKGNDLVLQLCRAVDADSYVSGTGCLDFIEPQAFENRGIEFFFQKFEHPVYRQTGSRSFVSHLSILDALFNVGPEETRAMIAQPAMERAVSDNARLQ